MKTSLSGSLLALMIILASAVFNSTLLSKRAQNTVEIKLADLPKQFADWKMIDESGMENISREVLQLDSYIKRTYRNNNREIVYLYVGYWKKQSGDKQAAKHTPRLCLPSNGWLITTLPAQLIKSPVGQIVSSVVLGQHQMSQAMFYYWFFAGERTFHQDWKALLYIGLERLLRGRSDGGIVEISAALNREKHRENAQSKAQSVIEDFVIKFWPEMEKVTK
ncbi:MAG: EpsI family protein [Deltaproteobacteria bacterium]|nr:EpsI family protein [Deltaproteobacteria bacterium]